VVALTPGTRLGIDEVTAQIASTILPPSPAADPGRPARFQREAQILAFLNRPNTDVDSIFAFADPVR